MTAQEAGFLRTFYERVGGRTDRKQGVLARQIRVGEDNGNIETARSLWEQKYLYSTPDCAQEDWYLSPKGKEWVETHPAAQ